MSNLFDPNNEEHEDSDDDQSEDEFEALDPDDTQGARGERLVWSLYE